MEIDISKAILVLCFFIPTFVMKSLELTDCIGMNVCISILEVSYSDFKILNIDHTHY